MPEAYANLNQLPLPDAKHQLFEQMRVVHGTIDFYSFDFWSEQTGLDITDLHQQESQRIAFRADAEAFLDWLAQSAHEAIIATNADHNSLRIKEDAMALSKRVDHVYSSQDFGSPKEDQAFWAQLQQRCDFDPQRTLFLDDTERVLDAAAEFGIGPRGTFARLTPNADARPSRRTRALISSMKFIRQPSCVISYG